MPTYDKQPSVDTGFSSDKCLRGWDQIAAEILANKSGKDFTVCVDCYPGTLDAEIAHSLAVRLKPTLIIRASEAYRSKAELRRIFDQDLTDDPVFGRMNKARILDFFDPALLEKWAARVSHTTGIVLIIGTGASLLTPSNSCLVYADMARWQIQLRQRRNLVGNLGTLDKPA